MQNINIRRPSGWSNPPPPPPIDSNLNKKANPSQNNNNAFENQLQKIHDRVATFVLNQIDLQLNKLDGNLNLEENLLVTGNKNSQKHCPSVANTPNLQGDVGLSPSKKKTIYSAGHFYQ